MEYTVFETFVGAGGSHLGFKNNGFKSVFVNDLEQQCIDTLLYNNPEIRESAVVKVQDMTTLNPEDLLKEMHMNVGDLDVMFGGIVCKGFSLAGERSPSDPRNKFYQYQLNLVRVIRPKISVIENVPGIANAKILSNQTPKEIIKKVDELWKELENYKGLKANARKIGVVTPEMEEQGRVLREKKNSLLKELEAGRYLISVSEDITKTYESIGYSVKKKILNSAAFGAHTKRERIIFVAVRNDIGIEYEYPIPFYEDESDYLTVGDALKLIDYSLDDTDNKPMNHDAKTVTRFAYVKEGENLAKIVDQLPETLKISKFYSRGSTMRLDSKKPSPTLVPGHSNFPIHPFENRCITVREAATITGFPKDYKFFGNHTKRCEQVGNAVPPALSTAIAKECRNLLDKYYKGLGQRENIYSATRE